MKKGLLSVFLLWAAFSGFTQTDAFRSKAFNLRDAVAIKGYDPVAYFTQNQAVKGKKDIPLAYRGVTYNFSSVANRNAFAADPAKYEPQYGGWCAYAMGHDGSKVEIDPETFKILNGKLFLFYNRFFTNTLKSWNEDEKNLHDRADANWQKLIQ